MLIALMVDIDGQLVFNEKKSVNLLEYTLNNNIVLYGGGSGISKVGLDDPNGKLKSSNRQNQNQLV